MLHGVIFTYYICYMLSEIVLLKCLTFGFLEAETPWIFSPQFPVPPESDHCSMLRKVRSFPYEMPLSFSPPLALLITEVITQNLIKLFPNMQLLWSHITTYMFLCPAFVQDPHPPTEDPRAFQAPNLLPWNNVWPRPTAAPARGGNGWLFLAQTQDKIIGRS